MRSAVLCITLIFLHSASFAQGKTPKKEPEKITLKKEAKGFYQKPYALRNSGSFNKGTSLLSFGYGFPNEVQISITEPYITVSNSGIGPIMARYEFAIREEAGIAPVVSYASRKTEVIDANGYNATFKTSYFCIGAIGFYHFNKLIPVSKLDVYAGVGLGYAFGSIKVATDDPYANANNGGNQLAIYALVGARYYFSKSFSVYAEAGPSILSQFNTGISFRFQKHPKHTSSDPGSDIHKLDTKDDDGEETDEPSKKDEQTKKKS